MESAHERLEVQDTSEPSNLFAGIQSITPPAVLGGTPTIQYTPDGFLDSILSNDQDLPGYELYRSLCIGVAGTIKMLDWNDCVFGPMNVAMGPLPMRPKRIFLDGTTARQIAGLR